MKTIKRIFAVALVCLLCLSVFAACGFDGETLPNAADRTQSDTNGDIEKIEKNDANSAKTDDAEETADGDVFVKGNVSYSGLNDVEIAESIYETADSFAQPVTVTVRSETAKITDSGRQRQRVDAVYVSHYYDLEQLKQAGYTKLKIELSMDVKEIYDGYQYFFLYSDTQCNANNLIVNAAGLIGVDISDDPSFLFGQQFEHGSGVKDTEWASHSFTAAVNVADLKDNLYLRYGASGYLADDWQNKNVTVRLIPIKTKTDEINVKPVKDILVRSEVAKITDSGRERQKADAVYLCDYYDLEGLKSAGYTKLKINLSLDVREINDGYQYFFFYSDSRCTANNLYVGAAGLIGIDVSNDPSLLFGQQFEHGSGVKDTEWYTHSFEVILNLGDLNDVLYIRYGASGYFADDWQNKNVTVSLEPLLR